MPWQLVIDDNFNRPDSSPGGAETTTVVGNGWIYFGGGTWCLKGGLAICIDPSGSFTQYLNYLARPENEVSLNQKVVFNYESASAAQHVFLRLDVSTNNFYDVELNSPINGSVALTCNKFVNGSLVSTLLASGFVYDPARGYQVECSLVGENPTAISLNVSIQDTKDVVIVHTLTDATPQLQNAGTIGLSFYQGPSFFSRIAYYVPRNSSGGVGFFGAIPVGQQHGGDASAGVSYGENEQAMLQKVYDVLRAYGLLS